MRHVGKNKLEKLKRKNKGNSKLIRAIEMVFISLIFTSTELLY